MVMTLIGFSPNASPDSFGFAPLTRTIRRASRFRIVLGAGSDHKVGISRGRRCGQLALITVAGLKVVLGLLQDIPEKIRKDFRR
jgi:hypothetical protein